MIIPRDNYLQKLIASKHNGMIKIVTGIRRGGKSFLLFNLFYSHLKNEGVQDDHIIAIALDDRRNAELRDPDKMLSFIDDKINGKDTYYILIDEIQMLCEFADVLNSFLHTPNVDVYVTGSNSRFLSKDVATEFRGRGDEIHLYPLSFAEYYNAYKGDKNHRWKEYYTYGGLPQLLIYDSPEKKEEFLYQLYQTVYLKDILERHRIKNKSEFEELMAAISSNIGSPVNPNKLSNTFKSKKGITIDNKTISKYLEYIEDAYFVERAKRYDVKGKKYINALSKYYFQDMGLRNALTNFRQLEETHIMENIIYNELRSRGFRVDVGIIETRSTNKQNETIRKQFEVDFVVNQGDNRYYIQSALSIHDSDKREQETTSFRYIADSFKKIIIVKDDIMPYQDENGYMYIGLFDFLLNNELSLHLWK